MAQEHEPSAHGNRGVRIEITRARPSEGRLWVASAGGVAAAAVGWPAMVAGLLIAVPLRARIRRL